jgi:hypothetical protein
MGDRAHVVIETTERITDNPPLYIYVHWMGEILPQLTATALRRAVGRPGEVGRLNAPSYTARIIMDELTAESVVTGHIHDLMDTNSAHHTGVGVSARYGDRSDGGREVRILWEDDRKTPPTVTLVNYEYATHEYELDEFIERYAGDSPYSHLMDRAGYGGTDE